jgi:predicted RNA binding protein YcfA (HicA-like mRNA interferase family)
MKKHKLLARLTNNPKNASFHDLRMLLLNEGFELKRVTGSHHIFVSGELTFVIPVHANRVKSVYVKRVIELINESEGRRNES